MSGSLQQAMAFKNANAIIRNPNLVKNRIFIGNLPQCTREELESICQPYAKVVGCMVHKNYGFVQFESEEIANKVAGILNKSLFKGNSVLVRNAAAKTAAKAAAATPPKKTQNQVETSNTSAGGNSGGGDYNDCEIIVVNRQNTKYAEFIENRLKHVGLRVDVLFPNEDVLLGKVLANISSRGCLYAILVTGQHEEHKSITVNILYGVPAEHRNMPLDDAIKLINEDFRAKLQREGKPMPKPITHISPMNGPAAPPLQERHPESIQRLLNVLADNLPLTVLQYDCVIKYMQDRRSLQVKTELGVTETKDPDPEIELQKQILNILNKPAIGEVSYELVYPDLEAVKKDEGLMTLLRDDRVVKALEELFHSDLLNTVGEYLS